MLLLEAGRDTPPGTEPADVLDTYPTSYYNPDYFWPELKVHWRLASNSPLTGYSQGRIMGGGSSVMGMVALRGTPDDYAEWEAAGATGWGWHDVLPFFRKLESDQDFAGTMHGTDGPVPVWRLPRDKWPPISKVLEGFAGERQFPFVADMNADFRDGYAVVPISNWPGRPAVSAGSSCRMPSSTCRSSALAPARAKPTGRPPRVATRCNRSPQKYRECEAQYPYCAHPARSERFTVSRDRPHSTGVESTTETSSAHSEVSAASTRITTVIRAAEARSRLLYPGCSGR